MSIIEELIVWLPVDFEVGMGRTSMTTKKTTTQSGVSSKGSSGTKASKTIGKTSKFGATGKTSSSNNGMTGVTGLSSKAATRSRSGFTTTGGRSKFGTSFASTFGDTTGESYKLSKATKKNSTVVKGLLRCCRFVLLMNLILLFAVFASRTVTDIDFKVLQADTK